MPAPCWCAFGTRIIALKQRASLKGGAKRLVVLGALDATGVAAIQIGKNHGRTEDARCIPVRKNVGIARDNGADETIRLTETQGSTQGVTGGKGVDWSLITVGRRSVRCLCRVDGAAT